MNMVTAEVEVKRRQLSLVAGVLFGVVSQSILLCFSDEKFRASLLLRRFSVLCEVASVR